MRPSGTIRCESGPTEDVNGWLCPAQRPKEDVLSRPSHDERDLASHPGESLTGPIVVAHRSNGCGSLPVRSNHASLDSGRGGASITQGCRSSK